MSQDELAARIGRKQSYISKLERAERRLDAVELLEVIDAIGCTVDGIFDELRVARDAERKAQADAAKRRGPAAKSRQRATAPAGGTRSRRISRTRAE